MNVIGIIAEYNPFHKGHAYQIEKIKREVQADYAIIAMSGDFVQRGAPALVDKYCRAQMALSSGADLVLELPVLFASSSAEYFAKGGVSLLCHTGVVTHLGFGTENGQLSVFQKIAGVLLKEPELYADMLNVHLKNGFSFPNARAKALQAYFASTGDVSFPPVWETLSLPNNILAIEYLKALAQLGSSIIPYPIKRQGNGYHDISREGSFCSAAAIRAFAKGCRPQHGYPSLEGGLPPSEEKHAFLPLADAMPQAAFEALCSYPRPFLFEDSFSTPPIQAADRTTQASLRLCRQFARFSKQDKKNGSIFRLLEQFLQNTENEKCHLHTPKPPAAAYTAEYLPGRLSCLP